MAKSEISSTAVPPVGGPYSQAVEAGGFLFTSGWGPHDPRTGIAPDGIGPQTAQILANLAALLAERGLGLDDVVKVTNYLDDPRRDLAACNEAYAAAFAKPYPVRTTVGVRLTGVLVTMDFVVALRR